jgi:hypothetical protein
LLPVSAGFFLGLLSGPEGGLIFSSKHWPFSEVHGIKTQMTIFFMVTTTKTSNPEITICLRQNSVSHESRIIR